MKRNGDWKLTWWLGAWKVKLTLRMALGYWWLGIGAGVLSWRNLYPYLQGAVCLGPFAFELVLTRPLPDWKPTDLDAGVERRRSSTLPCEGCGEPLSEGTVKWKPTNQWLCIGCKVRDVNRGRQKLPFGADPDGKNP